MQELLLNPVVLFMFFLFGMFLSRAVQVFLERIGAIESEKNMKQRQEEERQARIDALYGRKK